MSHTKHSKSSQGTHASTSRVPSRSYHLADGATKDANQAHTMIWTPPCRKCHRMFPIERKFTAKEVNALMVFHEGTCRGLAPAPSEGSSSQNFNRRLGSNVTATYADGLRSRKYSVGFVDSQVAANPAAVDYDDLRTRKCSVASTVASATSTGYEGDEDFDDEDEDDESVVSEADFGEEYWATH